MLKSNSVREGLRPAWLSKALQGGFTLVELMVVMAIAVILMSIAVLGMNSVQHHAAEELVSELHTAQMTAIRRHRPVLVAFFPNTTRCSIVCNNDDGTVNTRLFDLGSKGERFVFDNNPNPPGAAPAPDNAFIFSPQGFISTPAGNVAGHVYLTNQNNSRRFQIRTSIAGGIDLNRYNAITNNWPRAY